MEILLEDVRAASASRGQQNRIVELVHEHLGLASAVTVSGTENNSSLKIDAAIGVITVSGDFTRVLSVEKNK